MKIFKFNQLVGEATSDHFITQLVSRVSSDNFIIRLVSQASSDSFINFFSVDLLINFFSVFFCRVHSEEEQCRPPEKEAAALCLVPRQKEGPLAPPPLHPRHAGHGGGEWGP